MGLVTKSYTFSSGETIVASEHNSNFDTLYTLVNGNITNANIDASAAIADTKLAQITASDKVHTSSLVAASEAQGTILQFNGTNWVILGVGTDGQLLETGGAGANAAWTSLAGDVSGAVDATTVTDLTLTSEAQGTIAYFDGSNWVVLGVGTSGQYLQTQGAGANPQWATVTVTNSTIFSSTYDVPSGGTYYTMHNATSSSDEDTISVVMPYAGTINNLRADLENSINCTITIVLNGTDENGAGDPKLTYAAESGAKVDSTNTLAVSAGDTVSIKMTPNSTGVIKVAFQYDAS